MFDSVYIDDYAWNYYDYIAKEELIVCPSIRLPDRRLVRRRLCYIRCRTNDQTKPIQFTIYICMYQCVFVYILFVYLFVCDKCMIETNIVTVAQSNSCWSYFEWQCVKKFWNFKEIKKRVRLFLIIIIYFCIYSYDFFNIINYFSIIKKKLKRYFVFCFILRYWNSVRIIRKQSEFFYKKKKYYEK